MRAILLLILGFLAGSLGAQEDQDASTAKPLPDGRILVVGGMNSRDLELSGHATHFRDGIVGGSGLTIVAPAHVDGMDGTNSDIAFLVVVDERKMLEESLRITNRQTLWEKNGGMLTDARYRDDRASVMKVHSAGFAFDISSLFPEPSVFTDRSNDPTMLRYIAFLALLLGARWFYMR